ncbi:MAG: F0F1 ATP synthase subunit delta [Candidatus Margulisbacteria bacterium]|nr:F0F1 ATP synthase subunit delta [Candidatus Margulisiibacteriota bacterium]
MKHKVFRDFDFDNFNKLLSVEDVIKIFNELYQIRWSLLNTSYEIKFYLENNTVNIVKRKQILLKYLNTLPFIPSQFTIAVLFFLMETKLFHRLGYFINILKYYFADEKNLILVEIISRFPLNEKDLEIYNLSLRYLYKKKVGFIFKEDPTLIGGLKLRWYSGELDLSVKKKLNKIKELIVQGKVA